MKSKNEDKSKSYVTHTINVPIGLHDRIKRCMEIEQMRIFTEFANSAFVHRCREIERETGVDQYGKPIKEH